MLKKWEYTSIKVRLEHDYKKEERKKDEMLGNMGKKLKDKNIAL